MTLSKLAFWKSTTTKEPKVNNNSGKVRKFMSKISGAFMLPVSVMAVAGLFLGLGAMMQSQGGIHHLDALEKFGHFVKNMGDPVFGAMPILFAAAMIVVFTDEAGVAVFAGIIGYLVFVALQVPFISDDKSVQAGIKIDAATGAPEIIYGKNVMFSVNGDHAKAMASVVGSSLGFASLNTSVFGGILVGGVVAFLYNRFHTIVLPQVISFFGGKRFVSLVSIVAMVPLSLLTLLIWPWIGRGLSVFGNALNHVPYGFESLIFGFIERALIPFGLHHAFYAPLWWSNAGGEFGQESVNLVANAYAQGSIDKATFTELLKLSNVGGDQALWAKASSLSIDTIHISKDVFKTLTAPVVNPATPASVTAGTTTAEVALKAGDYKLFDFISNPDVHATKLGKFMAGKFSFMMFGLPAAAAAMVMAAPKENRKLAMGTVFPAALTSFVTGVTEPIEFTFLFLAPWLFFGFHAVMAAFSFMFANLASVHTGMTFSGGFLDMIIYGGVPFAKGTNFYWSLVIGAGYAPIYFFAFLFFIKKFNLDTPGRGGNTKLFTKKDVAAAKDGEKVRGSITAQSKDIVAAFGGWDNISKYANCATRLRYDVVDASKVDIDALKAAGAVGVVKVGTSHFQAIMGPQAESVNINIKGNIGAPLNAAQVTEKSETKPAEKHTVKENIIAAEHKVVETVKKDAKIVKEAVVKAEHKVADKLHKKPVPKKTETKTAPKKATKK